MTRQVRTGVDPTPTALNLETKLTRDLSAGQAESGLTADRVAEGSIDTPAGAGNRQQGIRGRIGTMEQPRKHESRQERPFRLNRAVHSDTIAASNLIPGKCRSNGGIAVSMAVRFDSWAKNR